MKSFSTVLIILALVMLGAAGPAMSQGIFGPEGLNMPGSYDSPSFSDPPTINAFAGIQKTGGTFLLDTSLATARYKTLINVATSGGDVTAGSYQFLFTSGPSTGEFNNKWTDVTVSANTVQTYTYHNDGGGANDNVTFSNGYYTVVWQDNGYTTTNAVFMLTGAPPVTFAIVAQSPTSTHVTVNHAVTVTVTASGTPSPQETTYVRYSTNNWASSSLALVSFTGSTGTATIPQQPAGSTVSYYVLSTTVASGSIGSNYDLVTLNSNTNNKANYSYTVAQAGVWTGAGGDGLWGTAANWSGGILPSSTDTATIAGGFNVSINTGFNVLAIVLGNGSSQDTLKFDGAATRRDTVGNVSINAGSRFVGRLNNQAGQDTLRVSGDLTNNGTFDMFPGGNTGNLSNANCSTIVFTKAGNQNIQTTGTPLLTRFGRIAFNKGSNANKVIVSIDVNIGQGTHAPTVGSFISTTVVSGLFLSGTTNGITQRGTWEQNAGTFYAYSTTISPNANAGFNLIGSASIYDSTGAFFIGCPSTINTSGSITINEGDKTFGFEDTITVTNGTFNIYGQLEVAQFGTPGVLVTVNGGTFNVYAQGGLFETMDNGGVNASSSAGGHLVYIGANGAGAAKTFFTMNGGSITLVNPILNGTTQREFVIGSIGGFTMNGGVINIGDGSNSATGWMGFQMIDSAGTHSLSNLVIQGGTGAPGRRAVLRSNLIVAGSLTITGGSALYDSIYTLTAKGSVANSGTTSDATGGEIRLSGGSSVHTLSGNGTYGSLELNDINGASLSGSPTVAGTLTLTNGTFTVGANTLTIQNPLAGTTSNFSTDGTSSIVISGTTFGINLPVGVTALNNFTLNNPNGSTLLAPLTMNGVLTVTSGQLVATSPNIVNLSSTGSLSEAGNGNIVLGTVEVTRTVSGSNGISKIKPGVRQTAAFQTFGNIGFDIDPAGGPAPGTTTITRITGAPQGFANQSIKRYYDVNAAVSSGLNANVVFHYDNSAGELNGDSAQSLALWRSEDGGSTWASIGGTVDTTQKTISQTGITNLSRWTASSVSMIPNTSQQSDIIAGPLAIPGSISSYATAQVSEAQVFSFTVRDGGATGDTDHVPTILKSITLQQGSSNTTTDWALYLQGAELKDGTKSLGLATISPTTLAWSNPAGLDTVPDDSQRTFILSIWLKTSLPAGADNKVFEFKINQNTDVNTSVYGSSMAPGGSDVVGTPGTAVAVVAAKLQFAGNIGNTVSGRIFSASVTALDTNGNLDADYSGSVLLGVSSGTGILSGTNPMPASGGTATFTDLSIAGHGPITLVAGSGILQDAFSNSFLVDSSAIFKVVAGGPNDTLYWDSPSAWTILSGYSHYGVPHSLDHVILDNTNQTGSYVIKVGVTSTGSQVSDTAATIQLGYPHNPNQITLLIPPNHTQYFPGALYWGDGVAGNYDFTIDSGGLFQNSSGVVSHNAFNYPAISDKDTLLIRKGGKYLQRSLTFQSGIFQMARKQDGDYGIVEFDVPPFSPGVFDINADGYWYPNLVLSNTQGAGQYYLFPGSPSGAMHIKGDFVINTGVVDSLGTGGDAIVVGGNFINNGTTKFSSSPLIFTGAQSHTVSGNPVSLGSGMISSDSVNLQTNLDVTGGTVQTTGTYIITFDGVAGVYDTIPATGIISTNSSTVSLNPSGSLNEGTNPVQGTVSATRVAGTGDQTFGNIGFEIVSAGVAPGSTTITRTNGIALSGNGHSSIKRYYDVVPAVNTALNASIKVSYAPSELNGVTESGVSPYSPILQKSTDGGAQWSGQGNTVEAGFHRMDASGVQSLAYRWTGADANAPLFISHTLVVDKLADLDGNPATKIDQTGKQWRLSLYRDSVSVSTLVNTGNPGLPHPGVLTTTSLESGKYIAVEADSIGWLHIGVNEHGSSLGSVLKVNNALYDTVTLDTLHPNSVDSIDFINQQISVVTIRKFRDLDGDPSTIEGAKKWGLTLYRGPVLPLDSVAGVNDTVLTVSGLQAGVYIAVEADSGSSWVRLNGNHTRYDTLVITAGQVVEDTFDNFRPNSIVMEKLQDDDGSFGTSDDRVLKAWHLELHKGTASGPLVGQTDAGFDSIGGLGDGTYVVTEADSAGWIHLGYTIGLIPTASSADTVAVTVGNGQSAQVALVNAPPIYSTKFRSFAQHAIAFDVDNKGKVNKPVPLKTDKDQFDIKLTVDSANVTDMHIDFGAAIDTAMPFFTVPASTRSTTDSKLKKWDFVFGSAITTGDSVHILGYAWTTKAIKLSGYWWTRGGVEVGKTRKTYVLANSILRVPMPNRVNALAVMLNPKSVIGFGATGLIIGKNEKTPLDSSKYYGWFQTAKYGDILKTLYTKGVGQPDYNSGHPFDIFTETGKIIKGKQSSMPISKEKNSLLANMIALKLNIMASDLGMTPPGLGDLVYDDSLDNPFNGMSLRDLAHVGDSVMMGWLKDSVDSHLKPIKVHKFDYTFDFNGLDSVVARIDSAFEGPIDTSSFAASPGLVYKGTIMLASVPYLHANLEKIPPKIVPAGLYSGPAVPAAYRLYQNYPNPFNPTTTIQFDLPEASVVTLKVYNILGQEVATLINHQPMDYGQQHVQFNANGYASGVYFYRLVTSPVTDPEDGSVSGRATVSTMKMLYVK